MTEPTGHTCPECGAPRGADNTPSCDCTQRASDALREARTAQAAAAEDFDPLRIRPYVEVAGAGVSDEGAAAETHSLPAVEATLPLRPVPGAHTADLRLFEPEPPHEPEASPKPRHRRSRRTVLLSVAGAGVAVVAAAGMASGLFAYHPPARDRAAAQEVRPSVPVSPPAATSSAPAPPASPHPAAPPASPSTDPSPTPTVTSASPTPTASPSPSRSSASPTPSATLARTPNAAPTASAPVLQRGDKGPEVTELQLRLKQLNLYGDQVSGVFTRPVEDAVSNYQWARGITDDPLGVYGAATRKSLESETTEP
ncbi:peptidoglycan-binding domain-containing protein [Streptomyces diastatochromogenes]|uniref:Peptidoglycan-binding protein n=1 Tax=Streptomyces diastatochromogenes TaxID=42236 RepID=A0A233SEV6_STRDA|nr:peptidoglycan-binding domain-containing protein [Streptomyces diastatochromogenes]OXY94170.1 peptidoglycan-binding protein [Streptomyces diastatochromogenes]